MMKKDDALTKIICEYADKLISGEEPDPKEYMSEYPGLKDDLAGYFEAVKGLSSSLRPATLPHELVEKVMRAVKSSRESAPAISQVLQRIIGRAVCDEGFRKSLFLDPGSACRNAGYSLSAVELAALKSLDPDNMEKFSSNLDQRITKKM